MNRWMNRAAAFLAASALCAGLVLPAYAASGSTAADSTNVIQVNTSDDIHVSNVYLALDNSWSMADTDPESLVTSCVEQFITGTPSGGSRIGVVTYAGEVETVTDLVEVVDGKADLGDYGYGQYNWNTNIGAAINAAEKQLNASETDEYANPYAAIVLITDGMDTMNVEPNYINYRGTMIPVYCIYINVGNNQYDGEAKDAQEYLSAIAEETGGAYYTVDSSDDISGVIKGLIQEIYNYDSDSIELPLGEVCCEVGDDVYEVIATIEYKTNSTLDLSITEPDGTVVYENDTSKSNLVSVTDTGTVVTVNIMWPDAGIYTFTMDSDVQQNVQFQIVGISANLNLTLSDNAVSSGNKVVATCSVDGNTNATIDSTRIHIYDAYSKLVDSSGQAGSCISEQSGSTFEIDTGALSDGIYSVVAVSQLSNGDQVASVKVPLTISKPFPIIPILLIVLGILLIIGIAIVLYLRSKGRRKQVPPVVSMLVVRILKERTPQSVAMVKLPQMLPNGKTANLYSVVQTALSRSGNHDVMLPDDLKDFTLTCWCDPGTDPVEDQYLEIVDKDGKDQPSWQVFRNNNFVSVDIENSDYKINLIWNI